MNDKNIRLVKADQKPQVDRIHRLYKEAFPPEERKPFLLIRRKCWEGVTEMLSIEDENGTFLGLAITMLDGDIVLLDYFAIDPGCREGGVGSAALVLLKERYEAKRFLLEIENTAMESIAPAAAKGFGNGRQKESPEQIQKLRLRRKSFYLRNGMTPLPFLVNLFGVDMEVLSSGCSVTFAEYRAVYEHVYGNLAGRNIRFIKELPVDARTNS